MYTNFTKDEILQNNLNVEFLIKQVKSSIVFTESILEELKSRDENYRGFGWKHTNELIKYNESELEIYKNRLSMFEDLKNGKV